MALIVEVLELLNTLIHFSADNTIQINNDSLSNIHTFLQYEQDKISFL